MTLFLQVQASEPDASSEQAGLYGFTLIHQVGQGRSSIILALSGCT